MTLRRYTAMQAKHTETARFIDAHNPDQAAEEFVRRQWGDQARKSTEVVVRSPRGDVTHWVVEAQRMTITVVTARHADEKARRA